jgi:hypothetical protein
LEKEKDVSLDDYLPESLKGKTVAPAQKQKLLNDALRENVRKGEAAKIRELVDLGANTERVFVYTSHGTHKESIQALVEKGVKITAKDVRDVILKAIGTLDVQAGHYAAGRSDKAEFDRSTKNYIGKVKLLLDAAGRDAFIGTDATGFTVKDVVYSSGFDLLRLALRESLKKHGLTEAELRGSKPEISPREPRHAQGTAVSKRNHYLTGKRKGDLWNAFLQQKVWQQTDEGRLYRKLFSAVSDFKLEDVEKLLGKGAKADADIVWLAVRKATENTELLSDRQAQDEMGWRGADTLNLAKKYGQVAAAVLSAAKREDLTGTDADGKSLADLVKAADNPWMELGLKEALTKHKLTAAGLAEYTGKHRRQDAPGQ